MAPGGIVDCLGEHATSQAFDVELFDGDQPVAVDQYAGNFVMKIPALVADMCVDPLQGLKGFAPPMTATLPPGHPALRASELRLRGLKVAGVLDARAIGERGERLQPDIEADRVGALRQRQRVHLHAETHKLPSGLTLERKGREPIWTYGTETVMDVICASRGIKMAGSGYWGHVIRAVFGHHDHVAALLDSISRQVDRGKWRVITRSGL